MKVLVNKNTKVVYPYDKAWAKLAHMEEMNMKKDEAAKLLFKKLPDKEEKSEG